MKKNILIVQNYPSPYRVKLFNLLNEKNNITVLYLQEIPQKRKWDSVVNEIKFSFIFCKNKKFNLFGRTIYLSNVDELKKEKFDLVLINTNLPDFLTMLKIKCWAYLNKVEQYLWVTTWDGYGFESRSYAKNVITKFLIHFMHKSLFFKTTKAIGYCEKSVSLSKKFGLDCISSSQYYPLSESYGIQVKKKIIHSESISLLSIAYIDERKDLEKAILAINEVEGITLTIAGSGDHEYISHLKELVRDKASVKFIGHVDSESKKQLAEEHDFLLFTTNRDSWGFVLNEAFYLGLPVIGSLEAMSVNDMIVDGENGFKFKTKEELVSTFQKIKNYKSNDLERLSLNAQNSISGFNESVLSNFDEIFDSVV